MANFYVPVGGGGGDGGGGSYLPYFLEGEGMELPVVQTGLPQYLGPNTTYKPGEREGIAGFWYGGSRRMLTEAQIGSLKADSARFRAEQEAARAYPGSRRYPGRIPDYEHPEGYSPHYGNNPDGNNPDGRNRGGRNQDPGRYQDERYQDGRYQDGRYQDGRYPDGRNPDRRYQERHLDWRNPDGRYTDVRHPDDRYPDERYADVRQQDGPYPDRRGPGWRDPDGRYPDGREPGGREPGGREPGGREPGGREPGGRGDTIYGDSHLSGTSTRPEPSISSNPGGELHPTLPSPEPGQDPRYLYMPPPDGRPWFDTLRGVYVPPFSAPVPVPTRPE